MQKCVERGGRGGGGGGVVVVPSQVVALASPTIQDFPSTINQK